MFRSGHPQGMANSWLVPLVPSDAQKTWGSSFIANREYAKFEQRVRQTERQDQYREDGEDNGVTTVILDLGWVSLNYTIWYFEVILFYFIYII